MPAVSIMGTLEPLNHPKRYNMEKIRGVKKKPKRSQSIGKEGKDGKKRGKGKLTIVEIQTLDVPDRVQQLIKVFPPNLLLKLILSCLFHRL